MIYFVGAGPGDPDLITVKGARLLAQAQVVVYAGSLVNKELLSRCAPGTKIYNSANMTLQQIIDVMIKAHQAGQEVVRLHTGDPSLYGAIQEQMDELRKADVPFAVIPGVSSFVAAAAAIPHELTLPGVTQTVILTRYKGRTAVPVAESMTGLAAHQATMCIFLSVHLIDQLAKDLLAGGYPLDTPVLVVEKATWPDEQIISGTLDDITARVKQAGITRTAMILVGASFKADYTPSRLYDGNFNHGFREGGQ
ncbi:precorrin-4 C(11)-methyltransferase [Desulfoscipio gibsoniae]|uniref:Cobalt-precorrin 4 C11-methyltransferase n=1 Tax=Desulfoscipio gibsoniae DSM 7213 TaxID=767817 RepID=R4KPA2_9FIRM|nr:precorrin-4 C(11)-methyltransferase [Desulfoscipio gibsoniae]AGL01466.1 cobalt-precorrin 4 C11-methyltransferase [Desulfoscipio gibsoniae DSM 7213]